MFVLESYSICLKIICMLRGATTLDSSCAPSQIPHLVTVLVSSFQPADDSSDREDEREENRH